MRFRIEEYRRPTWGYSHPFRVEFTEAYWPFGGWCPYQDRAHPPNHAAFETLDEARNFIRKEKEYLAAKEPIYHPYP